MSALVLTSDLVTQSQLSGAATRTGVTVAFAGSGDALLAKLETSTRLVILDLSQSGLDVPILVPRLKAALGAGTIVAFGPHVHKERLAAAAEAGCDVVISRGQFHAEMDAILTNYACD